MFETMKRAAWWFFNSNRTSILSPDRESSPSLPCRVQYVDPLAVIKIIPGYIGLVFYQANYSRIRVYVRNLGLIPECRSSGHRESCSSSVTRVPLRIWTLSCVCFLFSFLRTLESWLYLSFVFIYYPSRTKHICDHNCFSPTTIILLTTTFVSWSITSVIL